MKKYYSVSIFIVIANIFEIALCSDEIQLTEKFFVLPYASKPAKDFVNNICFYNEEPYPSNFVNTSNEPIYHALNINPATLCLHIRIVGNMPALTNRNAWENLSTMEEEKTQEFSCLISLDQAKELKQELEKNQGAPTLSLNVWNKHIKLRYDQKYIQDSVYLQLIKVYATARTDKSDGKKYIDFNKVNKPSEHPWYKWTDPQTTLAKLLNN